MNYWLVKTEPETFSWNDLVSKGTAMWDGVRNFQARNNIKQMKNGDLLLFYHTGKNPGIIALAEVVREHYPDPTASEGPWLVVDVKPVRPLKRFITLSEVKKNPELKNMILVNSPRLSVQPVKKEEFDILMNLENIDVPELQGRLL